MMRPMCLLFCALLSGAVPAWSQTAPAGLPDAIMREVRSVDALPKGAYTKVLELEAEGKAYAHTTGRAIADAQASGGQAWGSSDGADAPGHLLYGPYAEMDAGDYVVFFRIKVLEDAFGDKVGVLDAYAPEGAKVLIAKGLLASELSSERYVQVPLAFHHPGGRLECRLFWDGNYALRVDKVTVFSLAGGHLDATVSSKRVPLPVASGTPKDLARRTRFWPSAELFPRSKEPDSKLLVFDLRTQPHDWQFLLYSLQGIVNREKPRIYYLTNDKDQQWLDWMLKRGWITSTETLTKPEELFARFRGSVKGAVIPDSALPATKNVATMIAGVEDGVVVSPRLAKKLSLPILADLRGRWKTSVQSYRWALDNLWSRMNHDVLACLWPDSMELRDYLVQNKIFIFWIPGQLDGASTYSAPDEEMRFVEELLARTPANTPVMGYSYAGKDIGIGEGGGVTLFSEFGKFLVGSVGSSDLSVHSGIRVEKFRQPVSPVPVLEADKVYVCFAISDGDNLPVVSCNNWPQLWADKTRGEIPLGWTISPAASLLIPGIVDYYYATATSNDTFMAAVSGVGYCYPDYYALRFRAADRGRVLDDFLGLTDTTMRKMDLRAVCPSLGGGTIQRYAERILSAQSVFPDYGRIVKTYGDATFASARGIPVFRAATTWDQSPSREEKVTSLASQIREMAALNRPAFLHVFICNWFWDLPAMKEALRQLGPDYVAVGPDQLAALYRQEMERRQVQIRTLSGLACFEGQNARLTADIRNTSAQTVDVSVTVAAGLGQPVVEPSRKRLKPGKEFAVAFSGVPTGESVRLNVSGPFGVRELVSNLCRVRSGELAGLVPDKARLSCVSMYEAEFLNHQSGKAEEDMDASGARVWVARKAETAPGCVVYGPYASLEKGSYLALFRLKRTGEGTGRVALLETCVGGGSPRTGKFDVGVAELPINAWRWFPIVFQHPGGTFETRIQWPGSASLAADAIAVWKIAPDGKAKDGK